MLSNKLYDGLKWTSQILLPALATLYLALSGFWPLPLPEKIVGTISAVNVFLGFILGLSAAQYAKNVGIPNLLTAVAFSQPAQRLNGIFINLSDKAYEVATWIVRYLLPGLGALYFALSELWNFPYPREVLGTITSFNIFLGLILNISTAQLKAEVNRSTLRPS